MLPHNVAQSVEAVRNAIVLLVQSINVGMY